MSRNIHEPSLYRQLSGQRSKLTSTRRRPAAFRWWTPDCDLLDLSRVPDGCTGEEPQLGNGFAQPDSPLEPFSFRLTVDGRIQTKGFLDVSGAASGDIAWVMPGAATGETDFIPPTSDNDGFSLSVSTTGDSTGITAARGYIDASTGEVSVHWGAASATVVFRAWKYELANQLTVTTSHQAINWEWWHNEDPNVFEPRKTNDAHDPILGTDLARYVRLKKPGVYIHTIQFSFSSTTTDGWQISLNDLPEDPWGAKESSFEGPYHGDGWISHTIMRVYPEIDPFDSPPSYWPSFPGGYVGSYWTIRKQTNNSTLRYARMEIVRLPYDPPGL